MKCIYPILVGKEAIASWVEVAKFRKEDSGSEHNEL